MNNRPVLPFLSQYFIAVRHIFAMTAPDIRSVGMAIPALQLSGAAQRLDNKSGLEPL